MIPLPSKAVQSLNDKRNYTIEADDLQKFMREQGFSDIGLAELLGVTVQCVRLWVRGQRDITLSTSKVIRLLSKYPHLAREF